MAVKIAIANNKGGIGKTTTAMNIADILKRKGYRVLLIELDMQRNASSVYHAVTMDTYTLADIMYDNVSADKCIQHTDLGDIIPSDITLRNAENKVANDADRFYHLADACKCIEDQYDYIICDCPPLDGVLLGNALIYVDQVIIPITCDKFGIEGIIDFNNIMSSYTKRLNPDLKIIGLAIIKYKGRQKLTRDIEDNVLPKMAEQIGTKVFDTRIRESVCCQEAQALGQSLMDYAPKCTTAVDYNSLVDELLKEGK